jgi:integrase
MPPRLTVVWQLDRWGDLVHPKTATSRRTIPLRAEVAAELEAWRHRQQQRAADGFANVHGLVFTTRSGHPIDQRNVSRAFHRARTAAGVDHGSLKTFRSTVATQLAEAGLHPSKTQAFLGHAHVTTTMTYYTAISRRRRGRRPPARPRLTERLIAGDEEPSPRRPGLNSSSMRPCVTNRASVGAVHPRVEPATLLSWSWLLI